MAMHYPILVEFDGSCCIVNAVDNVSIHLTTETSDTKLPFEPYCNNLSRLGLTQTKGRWSSMTHISECCCPSLPSAEGYDVQP